MEAPGELSRARLSERGVGIEPGQGWLGCRGIIQVSGQHPVGADQLAGGKGIRAWRDLAQAKELLRGANRQMSLKLGAIRGRADGQVRPRAAELVGALQHEPAPDPA